MPPEEFKEYIEAEIAQIEHDIACKPHERRTERNMKILGWIRENAPTFRRKWNENHGDTVAS